MASTCSRCCASSPRAAAASSRKLAAWICHEVLDALDYAHDVNDEQTAARSASSIATSRRRTSCCRVRGDVKLVDFGIARAIDPDRAHKSKTGTLKGKYGYMRPEQVIELPLDGRSDVFSVGVVLAELLTGRRLFAAPNELDVLLMVRDAKLGRFDKYGADIEPGLQAIVRKALKKPLDERWAERRRVPRRARRVAVRASPPHDEQAGRRRRRRASVLSARVRSGASGTRIAIGAAGEASTDDRRGSSGALIAPHERRRPPAPITRSSPRIRRSARR